MAYRCLESWTAGDGNTYQLAQINDFTTIPTSIINATSMTYYYYDKVSACPSYITDLGDLVFDLQRSIDADVTLNFVDTDSIRVLFGRYNMNDTGSRMSGDQWKDLVNSSFFKQGGWSNFSSGKIKFYVAVVIDDENERAYVYSIENCYYHWAGNTGWTINVLGGKPNDVDLFFEVFGPHIPKYTANGGGATHIAKVTGQLKNLSSNLSDILLVSGGGGGGLIISEDVYAGKDAGGISGSGNNSANQTMGYAFGQGESGEGVSGGGGGLYGGYKGGE